ncbi:MAG: hypothetical protein M1476_04290 [Candidatus Thermoplasmatota archaeon]|nr:hypothetical protein [Candidatus Thermoplasmatota archaeon]
MVEYAFNDYNQVMPYSSVIYLPPSEFRRRWKSSEEFRTEYVKFPASAKRKQENMRIKRRKLRRMESKMGEKCSKFCWSGSALKKTTVSTTAFISSDFCYKLA